MIIYNVTIKIDLDVHDLWLRWMQDEHIPEMLETGYFFNHRMMRVLEEDQSDGITYAIEYHANSMQDYFDYLANEADRMRKQGLDRFPGKFVAHRTLLREP